MRSRLTYRFFHDVFLNVTGKESQTQWAGQLWANSANTASYETPQLHSYIKSLFLFFLQTTFWQPLTKSDFLTASISFADKIHHRYNARVTDISDEWQYPRVKITVPIILHRFTTPSKYIYLFMSLKWRLTYPSEAWRWMTSFSLPFSRQTETADHSSARVAGFVQLKRILKAFNLWSHTWN